MTRMRDDVHGTAHGSSVGVDGRSLLRGESLQPSRALAIVNVIRSVFRFRSLCRLDNE